MSPVRKFTTICPAVLALLTALALAVPGHGAGLRHLARQVRSTEGADVSSGALGLAWSTYLGGTDLDTAFGAALDGEGNAYIVGLTLSADFPSVPPVLSSPPPPAKALLVKVAPDGRVLFSTFLGGSASTRATAVTLGVDGSIYVAGLTGSGFPLVQPLPAPLRGVGGQEAFVMRLSADGSQILFSTTIGGSGNDYADAIAVDAAGAVYLAGGTNSADFPTASPAQGSFAGGLADGFVAKILPASSTLAWSTYLGGHDFERINDIVTDESGGAVVVGVTDSPGFPTLGARQPALRGPRDGFIAAFGASGALLVSTYLGGNNEDAVTGVARDSAGFVYVGGATTSRDFPTTPGAFQRSPRGIFATKLTPDLASWVWSTYFGGTGGDGAEDLDIDAEGNVYLTGVTQSTDFPLRNPVDSECAPASGRFCEGEAFLAALSADGSSLLFSTYLGGSLDPIGDGNTALDIGQAIDVGPGGDVVIAGEAFSLDFPTTDNAFQPTYPGGQSRDAFAARFARGAGNRPPDCSAATASPSTIWAPNQRLLRVAILGVADPDGDPVTLTVTAIRQDEPRTGKEPDARGVGTAQPWVRASRAGRGDGRVYHIKFQAQDPDGASCTGEVTVCVPHDRSGRGCGDGGALFDSGT
ncbi:MAG TPA: SBBP repeat-containing protein [Thermoanaerobaculia bacterium]|nr:SBBP repeat-containing protein [Thermoanaerobaculia bacterium]